MKLKKVEWRYVLSDVEGAYIGSMRVGSVSAKGTDWLAKCSLPGTLFPVKGELHSDIDGAKAAVEWVVERWFKEVTV